MASWLQNNQTQNIPCEGTEKKG